jgi:hypothetical protein
MSPDFRYHVATLSAVFLALGIGILIGTAFVGAPVVSRQTQLIRRLEDNVGELRRETRERDRQEEALRIALPAVVQGRLAGKRVLVVQAGGYPAAAEDATEALRLAGADVIHVSLPADGWHTSGDDTNGDDAVLQAARTLAPLLTSGSEAALQSYREEGKLTGDALTGGAFPLVVLVGGAPLAARNATSPDEPAANWLARTRDSALAEVWKGLGITVVGVEPFGADLSFMRTYQSAGIATIDAIDRPIGKMALPFALLGEKGNYGLKDTADRALPAALETVVPSADESALAAGAASPAP